jgi:hypothetical protein
VDKKGRCVVLSACDLVDGTPVLDVKVCVGPLSLLSLYLSLYLSISLSPLSPLSPSLSRDSHSVLSLPHTFASP